MSWAYPPYKPSIAIVLDVVRFNENLAEFAQETDGNLNEHNFEADLLTQRIADQLVAADLALKLYRDVYSHDPTDFRNAEVLKFTTEWAPFTSSTTNFSCPEGKVFIVISFQFHADSSIFTTRCPGANFAIEIDGAVQMSSLLGAGDPSNEYTLNTDTLTPEYDFDSSPSFRAFYEAKQVQGTFNLSGGNHTIRLTWRNLTSFTTATPADHQWISQCEVFAMWMWA